MEKTLRIEDNGWDQIWIAEYINDFIGNSGTRIVERFNKKGSWEENMKAAKARLAELG